MIEMKQRASARDFCFIDFVVFIDSLESSFAIEFYICHIFKKCGNLRFSQLNIRATDCMSGRGFRNFGLGGGYGNGCYWLGGGVR